jgi:hypothetical protein
MPRWGDLVSMLAKDRESGTAFPAMPHQIVLKE